jgi:bacteriocin-like protein
MAKNPKTNRTQLSDLAVNEQELSEQEMAQVQGGTSNLNLSKSTINTPPPVLKCSKCGKVGVAKDPCCTLN